MKKKTFLLINVLLIFIIILLETKYNGLLTDFDLKVSEFVWSFRSSFLTSIMKFISFLASFKFIIIILIIVIIIKKDIYFPLNMSISTLINILLKRIFKRVRPQNIIVIEKTYSFPSGHAMSSMSFYGYIIYKVYNSKISIIYKRFIISLLSILILLIGFSRIYLGAHYLSDVVCGYLISLEYLIIYLTVLKIVTKK
ncbi:MAG: phosphatase PAP2 family protein [Bacilli bacterium]|nr:phosphatase PAP2 family protein [Bacilli bacterium]